MEIQELYDAEKKLDVESSNIKEEFVELLHMESTKNFEQPKKNKLLFYFAGTIKNLKNKLTKKL